LATVVRPLEEAASEIAVRLGELRGLTWESSEPAQHLWSERNLDINGDNFGTSYAHRKNQLHLGHQHHRHSHAQLEWRGHAHDVQPECSPLSSDGGVLGRPEQWTQRISYREPGGTSFATLISSPNPSTQGQAVTFTATITSPTVMPTGPVTFAAGKTVLGTAQLSGGGKAKFTTSTLAVGSTEVTATYYGNSNIAKSSASVTQTVHQ